MKRLTILVAAIALLAAACSSSSSVVATVGDTELTRSQVENMVRETDDILDSQFLTYLGVAIQWLAVEQAAAEDFDLSPTADEVDARLEQLVAESGAADLETYLEQVNASEDGIRMFATQLIIQEFVTEALADDVEEITDDDIQAELDAFPRDWTEVCSAHILVATEDEANAVLDRIEDGETFEDLAMELSTDPGSGANGGDLGCTTPTQFVEEFADATMTAEIGVPTEPVESQFGFHIIRVDSRETADADLVRQYLEGEASAEVIDAWFLDAIDAAVVTVDESVGTWTTDPSPQVLPPS